MRGPSIFPGYFKLPEKTAEAIDAAGWLHTGDVGEWTPSGCLRIIDRKKNIFKLAQGEYVAAEKIENVCARCQLIAQCFVYGDSLQSWLVGIVVPDPDEVAIWLKAENLPQQSLEELLKVPQTEARLNRAILAQIVAAAKGAKLAGFEIVKRVHLEREMWSAENGLLTPTFKLKRNEAKLKYKEAIASMYAAGIPANQSRL